MLVMIPVVIMISANTERLRFGADDLLSMIWGLPEPADARVPAMADDHATLPGNVLIEFVPLSLPEGMPHVLEPTSPAVRISE